MAGITPEILELAAQKLRDIYTDIPPSSEIHTAIVLANEHDTLLTVAYFDPANLENTVLTGRKTYTL